jgi:hypothetical protein
MKHLLSRNLIQNRYVFLLFLFNSQSLATSATKGLETAYEAPHPDRPED